MRKKYTLKRKKKPLDGQMDGMQYEIKGGPELFYRQQQEYNKSWSGLGLFVCCDSWRNCQSMKWVLCWELSHFDWKWCYRSVLVIMLSEGTAVDRKGAEEKDTLIFCEHGGNGENEMSLWKSLYAWPPFLTLSFKETVVHMGTWQKHGR